MIIPIVFPSAALFWQNYNPAISINRYNTGSLLRVTLPDSYEFRLDRKAADQLASVLGLSFPIAVMSPTDQIKYKNKTVQTVQRPNALPANSFIDLTDYLSQSIADNTEVYIASPELCFLQAAQVMDFHQLVIFGTDLCGIYLNDPDAEYQQRSREPITSVQKIKRFLANASNSYGHRNALRAVNYILDRSNSKMETMLAVLARLPFYRGGYALVPPELNKMLTLSEEALRMMHGKPCFGDMVWELIRLVVEYDSDISHLTSEQHRKDKRRTSAMGLSGYKTISITKSDVSSLSNLDKTFSLLRHALGMNPMKARLEKYRAERQKLMYIFKTFQLESPETYRLNKIQ